MALSNGGGERRKIMADGRARAVSKREREEGGGVMLGRWRGERWVGAGQDGPSREAGLPWGRDRKRK